MNLSSGDGAGKLGKIFLYNFNNLIEVKINRKFSACSDSYSIEVGTE